MNKNQRREIHNSINRLSHFTVGRIVRSHFPNVSAKEINVLAKKVISAAHELVSPKEK
jgi:adenine deaminase